MIDMRGESRKIISRRRASCLNAIVVWNRAPVSFRRRLVPVIIVLRLFLHVGCTFRTGILREAYANRCRTIPPLFYARRERTTITLIVAPKHRILVQMPIRVTREEHRRTTRKRLVSRRQTLHETRRYTFGITASLILPTKTSIEPRV